VVVTSSAGATGSAGSAAGNAAEDLARASTRFADLVTDPQRRAAFIEAGLWDGSTLGQAVTTHARVTPTRIAVVDRDGRREVSYGQLVGDAQALAAWMQDDGLVAGDVVSVQLPNWYETVVVAIAAQLLGLVVNPLLPNYRLRELTHAFATAMPKLLFSPMSYRGCDHVELGREAMRAAGMSAAHVVVGAERGGPYHQWGDVVRNGGQATRLHAAASGRVCELIFTSGTEAVPKAIMHTEDTANFSVRTAFHDLGMTAADVVWMPSPLGHSTGFNYGLRMALYHGLRLVLQDRWQPATAIDLITTQGCTYTLSATTFLQDLVEESGRRGASLGSLRLFGCGGAPVPPALVAHAQTVGIEVLRLYGSTEVLVATWNRPHSPLAERMNTDGVAMSDVEVEVRDEDGQHCPAGEPGEIHVRGPNTSVGFFADPDRTEATFADGWVRSGDLAVQNADGYVSIVGRKKEIIIRGGINIAPREIEELLSEFPEVRQAAVLGVTDPRLGERVCACVALHPGHELDVDDVRARLRGSGLAGFKIPELLRIVDAIPMTASGKVQKHLLAPQLEQPNA
jgi:acyl-coenzyme A synthetase/AMP-(fatty) acid ligase